MFTPFAYFASGEVPFLPTDVANLEIWWDAQQGITLSGTDVVGWADQGGKNYFATQSSAPRRPSYSSSIAAINNLNAVNFTNTSEEFMDIVASDSGPKPWVAANINNSFTMFVVTNQKTQATAHYGVYITQGSSGRTSVGWGPQTYPDAFISYGTDNYAAGGAKVSGSGVNNPFTTGSWNTAMVQWSDWANRSTTSFRVNGVARGTTVWGSAPLTPSTADPRLGRFVDTGADSHLNAFVAELIVYTGSVSATDILKIEGYLKTKYGHYA
jgi:hypothetical protein